MIKNKQILLIDQKYKHVFKKICQQSIDKYNQALPLEWEDIYYKFLYYVPKMLEKFDPKVGVSQNSFLFLECKYFASNECRKFSNNHHKVMNFRKYVPYENTMFLSDSQSPEETLDISCLSDFELEIFNLYFLKSFSIVQIRQTLTLTPYRIRKTLKRIIEKINLQLKK